MTPEQQRIKIAETCGWKPDKRGLGWLSPHGYYDPEPDYLNDLNAMHEAETAKGMHHDQMWIEKIVEIALQEAGFTLENSNGWDWVAFVARLSAVQRAESFLKTLGLWEETK